jgi:arylformamidase
MKNAEWIDITVPLADGMVHWPDDPPVQIRRVQDLDKGDSHTLSLISMGSHCGTHVDSPAHYLEAGPTVDQAPLEIMLGPARVVEMTDVESIKPDELRSHDLRGIQRILFRTRNSAFWHQGNTFRQDYVYITIEAAAYLVECGVRVVGVDYLSVGGLRDGAAVHRTLLGAGIWIIEGLDLSGAAAGDYELACLPLKIKGGDGAPARAVLRPIATA